MQTHVCISYIGVVLTVVHSQDDCLRDGSGVGVLQIETVAVVSDRVFYCSPSIAGQWITFLRHFLVEQSGSLSSAIKCLGTTSHVFLTHLCYIMESEN